MVDDQWMDQCWQCGILLLGILFGLSHFTAAQAAETIVLKYGILRESISVTELSDFATTGELSSSLASYLGLAKQEPQALREVLNQPIAVHPVTLSKLLNRWPGDILLTLVSDVIHTPSGRASEAALRSALVNSAVDDQNIRLIEMLENYPTPDVHVDGDRLVEVYRQLDQTLSPFTQIKL